MRGSPTLATGLATGLVVTGFFLCGCRPANEEASPGRGSAAVGQLVVGQSPAPAAQSPRRAPAGQRLRDVMNRYRTATSYRDAGQVLLEVRNSDQPQRHTAPLSVWYDRGRLAVEAYDVRIRSDSNGLLCRILDPATDDLDSQVLFAPPQGPYRGDEVDRPALEAFLQDPVLAERIAAGLAGPPPQLEWLLADEPMPGLFASELRLAYEEDGQIEGDDGDTEGHGCHRIAAEIDGERYVFWIDPTRGLIRRIELPDLVLSVGGDQTPPQISLRLDLRDATFAPPGSDPPPLSLPPDPKYVRRFVPLPPPQPPALLGQTPQPFSIRDRAETLTLTERGGNRDLVLIVALGEDAGSRSSLALIEPWAANLPSQLASRVRTILLVEAGAMSQLPREVSLPVFPDRRRLSKALGIPPGGLAILTKEGRIAWLQPSLTAPQLPVLGAVLADLLDGIDVPRRMRDQWQAEVQAYRRELDRQRFPPSRG